MWKGVCGETNLADPQYEITWEISGEQELDQQITKKPYEE